MFIPLFDPSYDTYDSLMERTPWTFDAVLAIAAKIRSGSGPLSPAFYRCLEEAQGIARSSLFGPVVRKEAIQGQWFPCLAGAGTYGHSCRYVIVGGVEHERLASQWPCHAHGT